MFPFVSERVASFGLICSLSLVIVFHLLVLAGVVPHDIVWGGRLQDKEQMLVFEAVSILLNLLMLTVVALRAGLLKWAVNPKLLRGVLAAMAILFLLNTVGNMLSVNQLEKMLFTPITAVLAVFCARLALARPVAPAAAESQQAQ